MQHQPNTTHVPRGPVESDGFFTGVQIRPVILGVVIDYFATYLGIYAYFYIYFANQLSKQGGLSPEAISKYMLSPEGMVTGMTIGILGTAVGGLAAGLKAGNREIKHGAFVGLGSLIVSFIEQQLAGGESRPMPEWIRSVSILAVIPAGVLGGWLAAMISGAFAGKRGGHGGSNIPK